MNVKTAQLLPAHKDYGGQRQTHGEEPVPRVKRRDPGTLEGKAKCKEVPLRCQLLYLPRTEGGKKPTSTFPLCEKEHRKENAEQMGPGPQGGGVGGGGRGGGSRRGPGGSDGDTNTVCGFCKILPFRTISMSPNHNKHNFNTSKKRGNKPQMK